MDSLENVKNDKKELESSISKAIDEFHKKHEGLFIDEIRINFQSIFSGNVKVGVVKKIEINVIL